MNELKPILEALLFGSETPLSLKDLAGLIAETQQALLPRDQGEPADPHAAQYWQAGEIKQVLDLMLSEYTEAGPYGFYLSKVAGGYQFRSKPAYAAYLRQLQKEKPYRVSRSAMEIVSIIAYRQPIARAEIDEIRGVDCSAGLRTLLERGLVRVLGQSEEVGHPMLYGTTPLFLEVFNLEDLQSLPSLEEAKPETQAEETATSPHAIAETTIAQPDADGMQAHLSRIAEEMDMDQALLDELDQETHHLNHVETRVLDAAFPKSSLVPPSESADSSRNSPLS